MQGAPDVVRLTQLEAQVSPDSKYTRHVYDRSEAGRRRVRKEEEWQRIGILGTGTFGQVHLEKCIRGSQLGRLRAVKSFRKLSNRRFQQELHAIALFSHEHYERCFVKSYGWYEANDFIFISMEYVQNGDLQQYVRSPLPEPDTQHVISQVLEGIDYMHQFNFAHRDLKPANILVVRSSPDWWVKIADFGVSKRIDENMTALRTHTGTLLFEAPEILGFVVDSINEESYTLAVDIWSIGVITFMLLTGQKIFKDIRDIRNYSTGSMEFPLKDLRTQRVSGPGIEFVKALLQPQPRLRPSAKDSCKHAWIHDFFEPEHQRNPSFETTSHADQMSTEERTTYSKAWSDFDDEDREPTQRPPDNARRSPYDNGADSSPRTRAYNSSTKKRNDVNRTGTSGGSRHPNDIFAEFSRANAASPKLEERAQQASQPARADRAPFYDERPEDAEPERYRGPVRPDRSHAYDDYPRPTPYYNDSKGQQDAKQHEGFQFSDPKDIFAEFMRQGSDSTFEGLGGSSNQRRLPKIQTVVVERPLPVSLEDMFKGVTKKLKVQRMTYDYETGEQSMEDRILHVPIKRGLMPGSKIKYPGLGDETYGEVQDLHFIIKDKPHPTFVRQNRDLRTTLDITLNEAQNGWERNIQTIDGNIVTVRRQGRATPSDWEERFPEMGIPHSKDPSKRGDMIVGVRITV